MLNTKDAAISALRVGKNGRDILSILDCIAEDASQVDDTNSPVLVEDFSGNTVAL